MRRFIEHYGTLVAGLALLVFLLIFANNFASPANLLNVLKQVSFLSILAFGFTFALITSELDLSFANICSLSAVVIGSLISAEVAWPLAVVAGLATGVAGGALNAFLVTVLKVPSLISTLGTASVANGLAFLITGGVAFVGRWDPDFLFLGRGKIGPVPVIILFTLLILIAAYFLAVLAARQRPGAFARAVLPAQAVAISTQSSLASLPAMLAACRKLGVRESSAEFVLPLAVAIFRATSPAMNLAVVIYAAELTGVALSPGVLAAGIGVAVLLSLSTVSLPGTISFVATIGPIALAMGVPIEPLALLVAVEMLPDIMRTLANVTMNVAVTAAVDKGAGTPED